MPKKEEERVNNENPEKKRLVFSSLEEVNVFSKLERKFREFGEQSGKDLGEI